MTVVAMVLFTLLLIIRNDLGRQTNFEPQTPNMEGRNVQSERVSPRNTAIPRESNPAMGTDNRDLGIQ